MKGPSRFCFFRDTKLSHDPTTKISRSRALACARSWAACMRSVVSALIPKSLFETDGHFGAPSNPAPTVAPCLTRGLAFLFRPRRKA